MAMKLFLFFVFLCSSDVLGFLAPDGSTGSISGPASADDKTIQNLLNLIVNEQNSRIQLQNLVTTMDKKLNAMNARLVQMEHFNAEISTKLEKEKNNREHLEQMYTALEQRLNNSTARNGAGKADAHQTESSVDNLTNKVTTLQTNLTDINNKLINLTHQYAIESNELNAKLHNLTASDKVLKGDVKTIGTKVGNISLEVKETNERLENISSEIIAMKGGLSSRQHEAVGFSVDSPDLSSGTPSLKYKRLILNTGNGYNMTSGVFTCLHPGLYFFTATVYRSSGGSESYCYFYVNSKLYGPVTSGTGGQDGYISGSQSIVTELKAGDKVHLSSCAGIDHLYLYSSFSGFMISS